MSGTVDLMMGAHDVAILNVGAGDTKLSFDKSNPAERIRAARIVADMLRRGYALLIEVKDRKGKRGYQRVLEFREDVCEYIIADLDPVAASEADRREHGQTAKPEAGPAEPEASAALGRPGRGRRGGGRRSVPAEGAKAVAVARSAGG